MKLKYYVLLCILSITMTSFAQEPILPNDGMWSVVGAYPDDTACGNFSAQVLTFEQELTFNLAEDNTVFEIGDTATSSTESYTRLSDNIYSSETERMVVTIAVYAPEYFAMDVAFLGDLDGCILKIDYGDSSLAPASTNIPTNTPAELIYNDAIIEPVCVISTSNDDSSVLCMQSSNVLLTQINQVTEATNSMSISPDEAAFLILNAGGMPEEATSFGASFFTGPHEYEIVLDPKNLQIIEEDFVAFFTRDEFFGTSTYIPGGDMFIPASNYYQGIEFPLDTYIPGGDMFVLGEDTFIPGGDMFIPGGDMFIPGGDMFIPGGDMFIPGGDMFIPGGDMFIPGGDMFVISSDITAIPGGDMFIPGGDMFIPGGDMFFKEDTFTAGEDYFSSLMIDVVINDTTINKMLVVAGSQSPQSIEDVLEDVVNIDSERSRLYSIDPITGTQTLLDSAEYSTESITFAIESNTILALYVFQQQSKPIAHLNLCAIHHLNKLIHPLSPTVIRVMISVWWLFSISKTSESCNFTQSTPYS